MPRSIFAGQVWRNDTTGENHLVTRVYNEVFSTYAVLRKVGDEGGGTVKVKISKTADGVLMPGFAYTQEEQ